MSNYTYIQQVVNGWEENYKKGLLTFWILIALHNGAKHVGEVKQFIEEVGTNLTVDEKSLYRSLTRLKKMELLSVQQRPSTSGGPALNIYALAPPGSEALRLFYTRNIAEVFLTPAFHTITKGII